MAYQTSAKEDMTKAQEVAIPQQPRRSVIADMAARYGMDPQAFEATLRATVMPPTASREEFAAFCVVAKQYGLNPITREIFAMQKQGGGLIPIVSVDGWANILNSHPQFDGMTFVDHANAQGMVAAITCRIHRKDRAHPIEATEYLIECKRNTPPWNQWPRRMLRHKAMIQAARYAFGFAGIVDPDEAARYDGGSAIKPERLPSMTAALDMIEADTKKRAWHEHRNSELEHRDDEPRYKTTSDMLEELDSEAGEVADQGEYADSDDELPLELDEKRK